MDRGNVKDLTEVEVNRLIDRREKIEIPHNLFDVGDMVCHKVNVNECGIIDSCAYHLNTKTFVYGIAVNFGSTFYENERNLKLIET